MLTENFPKLLIDGKSQIQEAQRTKQDNDQKI